VAQLTPDDRDQARKRVATATTSIAILAAGAAGAVSILAWHGTTDVTGNTGSGSTTRVQRGDDRTEDDAPAEQGGEVRRQPGGGAQAQPGGGSWSAVSGGGGSLPPAGIQGSAPPGPGSGGGAVASQGS
jgi:hypothetical protein